MKKLLTILFIVFAISAKAQHTQTFQFNITHSPTPVFEWEHLHWQASYLFGGVDFGLGGYVQSNHELKNTLIGLITNTRILNVNDRISTWLWTGIGFEADLSNEDNKGDETRKHYFEIGVQFRYHLTGNVYLQQGFKQSYDNAHQGSLSGWVGGALQIR